MAQTSAGRLVPALARAGVARAASSVRLPRGVLGAPRGLPLDRSLGVDLGEARVLFGLHGGERGALSGGVPELPLLPPPALDQAGGAGVEVAAPGGLEHVDDLP